MTGAGVVLWRYEGGPLTITPGKRGQLVARLGHSESQVDKAIEVLCRFPAMWRRDD